MAAVLTGICRHIHHGSLEVLTPSGDLLEFRGRVNPGHTARLELRDWKPVAAILSRGAMGLAESYLDGEWDSPDLSRFLEVAAANEHHFGSAARGLRLLRLGDRLRHLLRANSRRQAQRNIAYHYDLGNTFYAAWLDPSMTYSSAVYDDDPDAPLEQAQQRKYARLAELAGVTAGSRVLEIGCGWGGFMEHAARRGADVTGVSISREQCRYAEQRMAAAGLEARARVQFRDYRDVSGRWDHIVSIEMFEAVGEAYWDTYARRLATLLAPGGRAALQVITIEDERFEQYRRTPDFIQRYVFPGGMLPSWQALERTLARAGLAVTERFDFGLDYARTLVAWRERFDAAWTAIAGLGFDGRFLRLWHYYLAYCEAGFRHGAIDVVQLRVEHAR